MDPPKLFNALISESSSEKLEKNVSFLIDCFYHNKKLTLCNAKDLKQINAFIRLSLSNPSTTVNGLNVLNVVVEQCSTESFSEYHMLWIQNLKKVIMSGMISESTIVLAVDVLSCIFSHASQFPEFVRNISTSIVPQFIQSINSKQSTDDEYSLSTVKLIGSFLKFFPNSCRNHVNTLKKKILVLLISDNHNLVELAASALAMISYVGTAGGTKTDREAIWTKFYKEMLGSVHEILNSLYDIFETQNKKVLSVQHLAIKDVKMNCNDPVQQQMLSCRLVAGLLVTIRKMLSTDCRDPQLFITVPIEDTLTLACRILNVNVSFAGYVRNHAQMMVLLSFIPILHNEMVTVVINLILACRRHMSLHDTTILQMVQQVLNVTSSKDDKVFEYGHPMSNLRVSIYELFVTWLEMVHSPGGIKNYESKFIDQMLSDVIPQTQSVSLDTGSIKYKSDHKKSKKAKMNFGLINSVDVFHHKNHPCANGELCLAALKALKVWFYLGGEDIRSRSLKKVHDAVLKLSFAQTHDNMQVPYKDPKCRTALYKLLLATIVPQHPHYVPELSTSIEIFSKGVIDSNREVTEACVEALAVCQMMINPRRRPMTYLTSIQPDNGSDSEQDDADETTVMPIAMEEDEKHNGKETESTAVNGLPINHEEVATNVIVNGQVEAAKEIVEVPDDDDAVEKEEEEEEQEQEKVDNDADTDTKDQEDDDDDVQVLPCPVQEDNRAQDQPQSIPSAMDVDSDSDEPKVIEDIEPIAIVSKSGSSKETSLPSESKDLTEDSKGAEEMLMTFVDAQPDVD